jgi:hypothetical protein
LVLIQVLAETSIPTEISVSTEPSISSSITVGGKKANTNDHNEELTNVVIAM